MSITSLTAFLELSNEDARIFHHIITFTGRLLETGAHVFSFGLYPMPEFIQQAFEHPCAKGALLALSSHHLCTITRSTTLDQLTYAYKEQACTSMSEAVRRFSDQNADALLAASVMLGWATWER